MMQTSTVQMVENFMHAQVVHYSWDAASLTLAAAAVATTI
jgi:hypothetical protein